MERRGIEPLPPAGINRHGRICHRQDYSPYEDAYAVIAPFSIIANFSKRTKLITVNYPAAKDDGACHSRFRV